MWRIISVLAAAGAAWLSNPSRSDAFSHLPPFHLATGKFCSCSFFPNSDWMFDRALLLECWVVISSHWHDNTILINFIQVKCSPGTGRLQTEENGQFIRTFQSTVIITVLGLAQARRQLPYFDHFSDYHPNEEEGDDTVTQPRNSPIILNSNQQKLKSICFSLVSDGA